MDNAALLALAASALALVIGLALGFFAGRSGRSTSATPNDVAPLQQALAARDAQLASATAERDGARSEASALRQRLGDAERLVAAADARLEEQRDAAARRLADLQEAQARLAQEFKALSADALKANNEQFLAVAEQRLKATHAEQAAELAKREKAVETMVAPIQESLGKVHEQLVAVEQSRTTTYAELRTQVEGISRANELLTKEASGLRAALRQPQVRGAWGELQLQRCLELGGMLEHCDFLTQATTDADGQNQRPDVLVQLVGNKSIIVDSKVPLEAYLDAIAEEDPAKREEQMRRHARHVRTHMDQLSAKAYWRSLPATPEYVVLFIPGESMLADALSADPELLVHAANKNVMLAGPVSLILMLRTAQHAWREDALARDARKVLDEGQALYQRLASLGEHLNKIGKGLASTVKAYNDSVGSIEKSVLPSARRLQSLKVADADPVEPKPMDEPLRTIAAPELTAAIAASERPVSLVGDSDEFIGLADELSIAEPISKDGTTGR